MRKPAVIPFLLILIFLSCDQKNDRMSITTQITDLQQKTEYGSQDSSLIFLRNSQQLIDSYPDLIVDSLKAENFYLEGIYYSSNGKLDSAALKFQKATELVKDTIKDWQKVNYFYGAHDSYHSLQRYGDCIAIADRYISLLDTTDYSRLAMGYFFYTDAYKEIPDYPKAIESNLKRIEYLRQGNDTVRVFPAIITQAKLYYRHYNNTDETFRLLDNVAADKDKLTTDYKRQLYGTYGVYHYYDENYEEAAKYYLKGLPYSKASFEESGDFDLLATGYNNLMEVHIDLGEFNKAKAFEDSIISLGLENIDKRLRRSFFKYQYRLASKTNADENIILNQLDTLVKYQDKIYEDKINSELADLKKANEEQLRLVAEKQEAELENLKLQTRSIILTISIGLLGLIGVLFIRQRKLRHEKEGLQMQQRLLRSQMNPHFTFNTLYAIQNKIKDNSQAASNYIMKFSKLLRLILENSMQNYVALEKELESLKEYMDLQLLRFPNKFSYEITLNGIEEPDLIFIPPMLLQPIIENSIEHGFKNIDYSGRIHILLTFQEKFIHCNIEDNGAGFNAKSTVDKRSASTELISDFLGKVTGSQLEVIDKRKGNSKDTGVIVRFLIPHKLTEDG